MKEPKLRFYEKSHTYYVGKQKLNSVTKFISAFMSPFDAKAIARKLASFTVNKQAKRGVRYWLNDWKKASEHGTAVHNALENYINGDLEVPRFVEDRSQNKFLQGLVWLDDNIDETKQVITEHKMHNTELGLAGTIDLLIRNADGTVSLVDWKTNKAIKKKGYKATDMCEEPLDDLPDCNYTKYALQLAVYAYMLELQGEVIKDLVIVHLKEDKLMPYEIDYNKYRTYVEAMFSGKKED